MFANHNNRRGGLLCGLICLALSAASSVQAATVEQPTSAEVQVKTTTPDAHRMGISEAEQDGDIIYVLYYRETASQMWFEWLVYTDLSGAQAQAKKFQEAGCETKILTRPSK